MRENASHISGGLVPRFGHGAHSIKAEERGLLRLEPGLELGVIMLRRNLRLVLRLTTASLVFAGQARAVTINFMINVLASSAPSVPTGPASGSFTLSSADEVSSRIWLDDTSGSALGGVSIPTSLDLTSWNFMRFDISLPDGQVFGTPTSFTVSEPGILMLLVVAPLAVRALRK